MTPAGAAGTRRRARLSRTLSRARWREYGDFLDSAVALGYHVLGLSEWVERGFPREPATLLLRHDVDQHPGSALRMLDIERRRGIAGTWYFRWRTAHPTVIAKVREAGAEVGLHYETLSRMALTTGAATDEEVAELIPAARNELGRELAQFAKLFGPGTSACPHGDSRVPHARNAVLLGEEDPRHYGIDFDGNEIMRGKRLARWMTDRSRADGSWGGMPPALEQLRSLESPLLCVVHPNNWVSGPGLWLDRAIASVWPEPAPGTSWRPLHTRGDRPPDD